MAEGDLFAGGFVPVAAAAAPVVGAALSARLERKLPLIRTLTAKELRGWIWAMDEGLFTPAEGERAALLARARDLGVTL